MHLWTATQLFVAGALFYTSLSSAQHPDENATRDSLARLPSQSTLHPRMISSTYRSPGGWTMIIHPGPNILPIEEASAAQVAYHNQVMTRAAVSKLTATRLDTSTVGFVNNIFQLVFAILERGPAQAVMQWNVVYWFAAYMKASATMGYTSVGSVQWRHDSSGTVMGVVLALLLDLLVGDRSDGGD